MLRGTWGGVLGVEGAARPSGAAVDDFVHEGNSKALDFYKQLPAAPEAPSPVPGAVKGVILYLCCSDADELRDLHHALASLHLFFTSRFEYPVLVLHDSLSPADEVSLRAASGTTRVNFRNISDRFTFPPWMTPEQRQTVTPPPPLATHLHPTSPPLLIPLLSFAGSADSKRQASHAADP
jgi:hypothetical protein